MGPGCYAATHPHAALRGARNPHVLEYIPVLCSVRLALKPLATVQALTAPDEPRQVRGSFFVLPDAQLAATMRAFVLPTLLGMGAKTAR